MDTKKLYVGNLAYGASSKDLVELFSEFGHVVEAMVIPDKARADKSKGFGFVSFDNDESVQKALNLNGSEFMGRKIVVAVAKEQEVISDGEEKN